MLKLSIYLFKLSVFWWKLWLLLTKISMFLWEQSVFLWKLSVSMKTFLRQPNQSWKIFANKLNKIIFFQRLMTSVNILQNMPFLTDIAYLNIMTTLTLWVSKITINKISQVSFCHLEREGVSGNLLFKCNETGILQTWKVS